MNKPERKSQNRRRPEPGAKGRWQWVLAFLLAGVSQFASADNDVVFFHNGDRLTGEVKSLERGKFRFKTAATDTISIEWDDVAYLSSDQNIQVEWELNVYNSYDSDPAGQGAEKNDYGISTSVGWDF